MLRGNGRRLVLESGASDDRTNEGWVRIAFDQNRIPYDYISVHDVRDNRNLRAKYDVIVFGPSSSASRKWIA